MMINIKFDTTNFNKILNNAVEYSKGFLDGVELSRLSFNRILGGYTVEALGEYIDSKARMNPDSLHHVYEWNSVGNKNSRLFKINVSATTNQIIFNGSFLQSQSTSGDGQEPFSNKAEIMEKGISITVEPRNSDYLVFEANGETVFTTTSITINEPGGPGVAGSFEAVIEEFFNYYFTNSILESLMKKLSYPDEFAKFFPSIKNGGRSPGIAAGKKYYRMMGESIWV